MPTLAYVVNPNEVTVIDTSTNTVINTIPIPITDPNDYAVLIAITPDGRLAYVTNLNGFVSVIDTCTNTVVDTIKVGFNPIGIAITPDGKYVYVANSFDNTVSVIDTSTNTVVNTVPGGDIPFGIAIATIPPCPTPTDNICIEATRIFDSCFFEEAQQKTFKVPNLIENQGVQCEILKTKCDVLDVTQIDELANLADVKLQIKVLLRFTSKYFNNDGIKRVLCFDKNIHLIVLEGSDVFCDINHATCECIQSSNVSSDSRSFNQISYTVKVTAVVKSKKLVEIEVPFLRNCNP